MLASFRVSVFQYIYKFVKNLNKVSKGLESPLTASVSTLPSAM